MLAQIYCIWCGILLAIGLTDVAQAQNTTQHRPAGATALCRDGSFSQSAQKRGACSRHKGVQVWYGHAPQTNSNSKAPSKQIRATATHTNPNAYAAASQTTMVWVNLKSGVFHCQGSRWYGKTNKGQSMPQAQALAHNYNPAGNTLCHAHRGQ